MIGCDLLVVLILLPICWVAVMLAVCEDIRFADALIIEYYWLKKAPMRLFVWLCIPTKKDN